MIETNARKKAKPLTGLVSALVCVLAWGAAGCAANPDLQSTTSGTTGAQQLAQQLSASQASNGVRVSFQFSDYYSLTSPNAEGCAGDARNFYDPIALVVPNATIISQGFDSVAGVAGLSTVVGATGSTGPMLLPTDITASNQTIRPSFIKNISVDLTDANANVTSNLALGCSLGTSSSVPATSSCATFDYGAIGGIPSTLGGTMFVVGGVQNYNYSGLLPVSQQSGLPFQGMSLGCGTVTNPITSTTEYTQCYSGIYALGVNTLAPSAFVSNPSLMPSYEGTTGPTGSVSMWANISGTQGYSGPSGGAGASIVYDGGLQQVLLFGGASPLANMGSNAPGVTTYDTWTFDLKSQQWTFLSANIYVATQLINLFDNQLDYTTGIGSAAGIVQTTVAPASQTIPKSVQARALFGYVSMPGMGVSLDQGNSGGTMTTTMIDPTDRLMIVGGAGPTTSGVFMGTHRFNPTYGPELQNVIKSDAPINPGSGYVQVLPSTPSLPVLWVDSYHTQLLNGTYGNEFIPQIASSETSGLMPYTDLSSQFTIDFPPLNVGPTGGQPVVNSAFAPLVNTSGASGSILGTGYVLAAGGFDASTNQNVPDETVGDNVSAAVCDTDSNQTVQNVSGTTYGTNTDLRCGGGLSIETRYYAKSSVASANESNTSYWSAVPDFLDPNTLPNTPVVWTQFTENANGSDTGFQTVPYLGGSSMLPGFSLLTNDIVLFGGIDCRSYVSDTSAVCLGGGTTNTGRYWQFGAMPTAPTPQPGGLQPLPPAPSPSPPSTPFTSSSTNIPTDISQTTGKWLDANGTATLAPTAAGMAVARGLDPAGKVIILAWGGATGGGQIQGLNRIYYLFDRTTLPAQAKPTWGIAAPQLTTVINPPTELINATMVFSHVTRKFYVFGGYDPSVSATRGDTYELTITSPNNAACTYTEGSSQGSGTGNCIFTWRQLDLSTGTGLTCYPSTACSTSPPGPPPRRSHRMAEVDYYNRNPGGTNPAGLSFTADANFPYDGEQPCSANAPCSYGIFMEGGSPDGINYLSDRWMFDPTANGGNGHWQLMTEFPPRALASMASVDFTLSTNGQTVHRAVLFGGETGLHNSEWAPSGYFVAPTLGDTWIFDFDNQSWNRVQLLGQGYDGPGNIPGTIVGSGTETTHRQSFDASTLGAGFGTFHSAGDLGLKAYELSPPPLSGAVMITRTQAPPPLNSTSTQMRTLTLPEVYMFGGRLKDGSFSTLDKTYKFCMGTTGEAFTYNNTSTVFSVPDPTDYICDAFDPVINPGSPSPSTSYVGRWLTKNPAGVTTAGAPVDMAEVGSYLGAGAYDPVRDRIVLFGGLSSAALPSPSAPNVTAVTDTTKVFANPYVYEYTPPQPQLATATPAAANPREGRWTFVPSCTPTAPSGRYGHTMAYDTRGQNIIVMGGYDSHGTPLTTTVTDYSAGTTYTAPQVWTGTYCADTKCGGLLNEIQPPPTLTSNGTPCYFWQPITIFGNSTVIQSQLPPTTGLANAASVFIPATGYNSGYYSMFDDQCANEGPIASADPSLNKLLAGGAYIDIDRTQLGANENLLLNITYLPMGTNNLNPDDTLVTTAETAVFRVHLIKTGQTQQQLEGALQPRYMGYSDTQEYPETVQSLSVMAPPSGQIAQEQVMVPITVDPGIDRIRIERYSGSGILLDAAVYRMGTK